MAMEIMSAIRDPHSAPVTALGFHLARREIMIGTEDGVVKMIEADTGHLLNTCHDEHKGRVTDFLYWPEAKLVLSSSNDGVLIGWGSGGKIVDRILMGMPVYCMAIHPGRNLLVCGMHSCLRVYSLDLEKKGGHYIDPIVRHIARDHTDIVKAVVFYEGRLYSTGFDQRLLIYEASHSGALRCIVNNHPIHNAGVTNLLVVKDNENSTWIVTGSFDKTVKVWSQDGKLIHKIDDFQASVSGLCFVAKNKTVWVASGAPDAQLYDPKSGDNITDFILTKDQEQDQNNLLLLKYFPESNQIVGTTNRRHIIIWKHNPSGYITTLKLTSPTVSLAYTRKNPPLIFTGDLDGLITKWERLQSNPLMYSKELLTMVEARKGRKIRRKEKEKIALIEDAMEKERRDAELLSRKAMQDPLEKFNARISAKPDVMGTVEDRILRMVFVEELDILAAASEDGNIYIWSYDTEAVRTLKRMEPLVRPPTPKKLGKQYEILLDIPSNGDVQEKTSTVEPVEVHDDSVSNRVAGFVCRHMFVEHQSNVTSLVVVARSDGQNGTFLVSGGWDRKICIWDLESRQLKDVFRNTLSTGKVEDVEIACDGAIHDMAYCSPRNEIAYASSDGMVYIRKFSTNGREMTLLNTLQDHRGEVTCVCWNPVHGKWVTGSEDGTLRIWSGDQLNDCEEVLAAQGVVTALCIDLVNGAIVAGVENVIRVFDSDEYHLVQTNNGHNDTINCIIHMPDRNQYISASADESVRMWNAYKVRPRKKKVMEFTETKITGSLPLTGSASQNVFPKQEDEKNTGTVSQQHSKIPIDLHT